MSVNPQGMGATDCKTTGLVLHTVTSILVLTTGVAEARYSPMGPLSVQSHLREMMYCEPLFEAEPGLLGADEAGAGVRAPKAQVKAGPEARDDHDAFSFFGVFAELHKKTPAAGTADAPSQAKGDLVAQPMPDIPEELAIGWEGRFQWGMYYSGLSLQATEYCAWTRDMHGSGGCVPRDMLRAETLLAAAGEAPTNVRRAKTAQRAMQIYYHAKWLAERNYEMAAEYRYRLVEKLALESRRSVLAAHALSRLGYFLIHWSRRDEAQKVLSRSMQLSTKSNPLAPYLLGVLDREAAGADLKQLLDAEVRILTSEMQPSDELQLQRGALMREIQFWRAAEDSPMQCLHAPALPHLFICVFTHALDSMSKLAAR